MEAVLLLIRLVLAQKHFSAIALSSPCMQEPANTMARTSTKQGANTSDPEIHVTEIGLDNTLLLDAGTPAPVRVWSSPGTVGGCSPWMLACVLPMQSKRAKRALSLIVPPTSSHA